MGRKKKPIVIEYNDDDIWDSVTKTKFRKSFDWIVFRNRIVKERKVCECCGYQRRLTLHHIYMSDSAKSYADLKDERFKVVCSGCHKYLHRIWSSYKRKKDPIKPDPRLEELLNEFIKELM